MVELTVAMVAIGLLIIFSTPILLSTLQQHRKQADFGVVISNKMQLSKMLTRATMAVNPVRFDPEKSTVNNQLGSAPWSLRNNVVVPTARVPEFEIAGLKFRQDSFTFEVYSVVTKDRVVRKETRGALMARCASESVYRASLTIQDLDRLKRPFLDEEKTTCCKDGQCQSCVRYNVSCCDSSRLNCVKSPAQYPFVFLYTGNHVSIYPAESDFMVTPGMGFFLDFDSRTPNSYRLVEFQNVNQCLIRSTYNTKQCSTNIQDYFLDESLKNYLEFKATVKVGKVVNDLNDGAFISIGDRLIGE